MMGYFGTRVVECSFVNVSDEIDVTGQASKMLAGQLMSNSSVLASLQERLEGMRGLRSGYIER